MGRKTNLIGQKFGSLTVTAEASVSKNYIQKWVCKCECGGETVASTGNLNSGHTTSCGCKSIQQLKTHGESKTRLYNIWSNMKARCSNPKNTHYQYYGGKGIKVCDEWAKDFMKFKEWSENNGYAADLTIDRKDGDGNYCPENCRWVSRKEQLNNYCRNILIDIDGVQYTFSQLSEKFNIKRQTLIKRHRYGWRGKDLIKKPK